MRHLRGAWDEFLWLGHISVFVGQGQVCLEFEDGGVWGKAARKGSLRNRTPRISAEPGGNPTFVLSSHPPTADSEFLSDMHQSSPAGLEDQNYGNVEKNYKGSFVPQMRDGFSSVLTTDAVSPLYLT